MLTIFTPDQLLRKEEKLKHALEIFAFDIHEFSKSHDIKNIYQFLLYLKTSSGIDKSESVYSGNAFLSKSTGYDFILDSSLGNKIYIRFEIANSPYSQSIDLYYWIE